MEFSIGIVSQRKPGKYSDEKVFLLNDVLKVAQEKKMKIAQKEFLHESLQIKRFFTFDRSQNTTQNLSRPLLLQQFVQTLSRQRTVFLYLQDFLFTISSLPQLFLNYSSVFGVVPFSEDYIGFNKLQLLADIDNLTRCHQSCLTKFIQSYIPPCN